MWSFWPILTMIWPWDVPSRECLFSTEPLTWSPMTQGVDLKEVWPAGPLWKWRWLSLFFRSKFWTSFHCQSSGAGIRQLECFSKSCSDLLIHLKQVLLPPSSVLHVTSFVCRRGTLLTNLSNKVEISSKMVNKINFRKYCHSIIVLFYFFFPPLFFLLPTS